MNLVINVLDYLIMLQYFKGIQGERKKCPRYSFLGYSIVVILILSGINRMGVPLYNLLSMILCVFLTSLWFESQKRIRFLFILLYIGTGLAAEIIVYGVLQSFEMMPERQSIMMLAALTCEVIRGLMVAALCIMKQEQNMEFPRGTAALMTVIFVMGIVGSVLLNIKNNGKSLNLAGVLIAISVLGIIYVVMFRLIEKTNRAMQMEYEKELLLQEIVLKELYYKEMEKAAWK